MQHNEVFDSSHDSTWKELVLLRNAVRGLAIAAWLFTVVTTLPLLLRLCQQLMSLARHLDNFYLVPSATSLLRNLLIVGAPIAIVALWLTFAATELKHCTGAQAWRQLPGPLRLLRQAMMLFAIAVGIGLYTSFDAWAWFWLWYTTPPEPSPWSQME